MPPTARNPITPERRAAARGRVRTAATRRREDLEAQITGTEGLAAELEQQAATLRGQLPALRADLEELDAALLDDSDETT